MTFEQLFKNQIVSWLSNELTTAQQQGVALVEYAPTIKSNNEMLNNPLFDNPQAYGVCVRNSTIVRSNIADVDFNTVSVLVESVMDENKVAQFLTATEAIAKANDSATLSLTDGDITYSYKPSFGLAYVSAPAYDLSCATETIGANNVSWIITIQYTTSSVILPKPVIALHIGADDIPLDNLLEYSLTGQPNYMQSQYVSAERMTFDVLNYTNAYVFIIRKTTATTGSNNLLARAVKNIEAGELKYLSAIVIDGTSYPISAFTVSETWRDNIAVFELTTTR